MSDNIIIDTNSGRAKWWLGTAVLFIALIVEIYFLVYFPTVRNMSTDSEPIAQLMSKTQTVRVQTSGDLVWDDTQANQMLNRRDSILTLERSRAEVAFLDGTGLIIDENSLVQLERGPEDGPRGPSRITIKLLRGTIRKAKPRDEKTAELARFKSSPELHIQVGEIIARVNPESELTVKADPQGAGKAKITIEKGKVDLLTPQGELSIHQGEEALISKKPDSNSNIATRQTTFALIEPPNGEVFESDTDPTVQFLWKVNGSTTRGSSLDLRVSTDPDFKTDLHQLRIGSTAPPLERVKAKMSLPIREKSTLWYWRVYTDSESPISSDAGTFWVQPKKVRHTPVPLIKEGYQSVLEPNKAPPPPSKIFAPEIEPLHPKRKSH